MRTSLDCIPCFVRQALEAARLVTGDVAIQEQIVREVLQTVAKMDLNMAPPLLARGFYRRLEEVTGVGDMYRSAKDRFNRLALDLLPDLEEKVCTSVDPFATALRLAIAGNMIDFGVNGTITEEEVHQSINRALHAPFSGNVEELRFAIGRADKILYLADNAGEIVLDRLLIERLPRHRVILVVRGHPVINDATMADAVSAGLPRLVEVIDNGSDVPGTVIAQCSSEFRRHFAEADLVIAKGQGNFETLSDEPGNIFFLFKVKCAVVSDHVGLPLGTQVLLHPNRQWACSGSDTKVPV